MEYSITTTRGLDLSHATLDMGNLIGVPLSALVAMVVTEEDGEITRLRISLPLKKGESFARTVGEAFSSSSPVWGYVRVRDVLRELGTRATGETYAISASAFVGEDEGEGRHWNECPETPVLIRAGEAPVRIGSDQYVSPHCGASRPFVLAPGKSAIIALLGEGDEFSFAGWRVIPL